MIDRIGRYRVHDVLGAGGMGTVYAARDERLDREVALKVLEEALPEARARFLVEARAAARVSHPHVCPIYDAGEDAGRLYLAMERLEGEPLSVRLERGAVPPMETGTMALAMLSALEALHAAGVVHRDLKPSNVFLTPHGVKLLDFGLAHSATGDETRLTSPGTVLGTPRYMAPEQIEGAAPDARADLFAAGAILYEMLSGRPAFDGTTMVAILYAVLHEQPPALIGSGTIVALDRVIQRALIKRPDDRYPDAAAMAHDLRAALDGALPRESDRVRLVTRLMVLPLRVLRPDPETDFLAYSLSDAVACSLSGVESLSVRSSMTAARFASDPPDLERIAREAEVDAVLAGTLLRAGDQVRVSAQLVDVPGGDLRWSQTAQVGMGDLFQLQDELAQRIVASLQIPLTSRERSALTHDVPASPAAYDAFLRANQLGLYPDGWLAARDLYQQCLADDPNYAPGWARLGRIYRVLSKYGAAPPGAPDQPVTPGSNAALAEQAFQRALELNPDLSMAHHLYAMHEDEQGRSVPAMVRLLKRAATRPADAELFAGLCHACRYSGLLHASIAAHERGQRIDPSVPTSVSFTLYSLGEYERSRETEQVEPRWNRALALVDLGREAEALEAWRAIPMSNSSPAARTVLDCYISAVEGRAQDTIANIQRLLGTGFTDPEGWYNMGRNLVRVGELDRGFELIANAVRNGYTCPTRLERDRWLDPVRSRREFAALLAEAETRRRAAREAFIDAGGERVLGPGSAL